ncbi:HD domain-containing protein [Ferrimonas lipolytica]|uniref:HD domain-containing protein n=1 Tax=Ferrimonas lipolytica TaxID=2724191 RepID=A0A6H1UAI1_9GAMM|nr:HD domain-containing protein [Ferrimonas lipolytica]QIZ76067.1 HD domain-containing protein [Ferrimonas lipolytica]
MTQFAQQIAFLQEIEKLKAVYRQTTVLADNDRSENSAEHSWHIALVAHVLRPYANGEVQIERVIMMLLIHDIVEVDAGDTFAFADDVDMDAQSQQELLAAKRIFGLLPAEQGQPLIELWHEFELAESADAEFAKAMDRILPLMQNMANDGGSWARHTVSKSKVLERNRYLQESAPRLWQYACEQIDIAVANGWLTDN